MDCFNPILGFHPLRFWIQPSDSITPISILITLGVTTIKLLSRFVIFNCLFRADTPRDSAPHIIKAVDFLLTLFIVLHFYEF
jgi:hypothetical protein